MVWPNRGVIRGDAVICLNVLAVLQTRHRCCPVSSVGTLFLAPRIKSQAFPRLGITGDIWTPRNRPPARARANRHPVRGEADPPRGRTVGDRRATDQQPDPCRSPVAFAARFLTAQCMSLRPN